MDATSRSLPVIGIVGGIGSGKSTVSRAFALHGCGVLDADRIGHRLLNEPDIRQAVRQHWGEGVFGPDGRVDRSRLGRRVFADPAELEALNQLLHPRIEQTLCDGIDRFARQGRAAVVLDAAVLFEAGWERLCTHTVFVDAPWRDRLRRVRRQRGWSARQLRRRQNSQLPLDKKASLCCHRVTNHSQPSHLLQQVDSLFHRIVTDSH